MTNHSSFPRLKPIGFRNNHVDLNFNNAQPTVGSETTANEIYLKICDYGERIAKLEVSAHNVGKSQERIIRIEADLNHIADHREDIATIKSEIGHIKKQLQDISDNTKFKKTIGWAIVAVALSLIGIIVSIVLKFYP